MPSMDTDLQRIMELAPQYSRLPNPAMRARDEACKNLRRDLKEALAAAPATAASSELDVSIGGRERLRPAPLGPCLLQEVLTERDRRYLPRIPVCCQRFTRLSFTAARI